MYKLHPPLLIVYIKEMEKQQEILLKIQSSDPTQIAEAIQEIKENGDLAIAKIILDTLPTIQDFHTRTTLINLLADIRRSIKSQRKNISDLPSPKPAITNGRLSNSHTHVCFNAT